MKALVARKKEEVFRMKKPGRIKAKTKMKIWQREVAGSFLYIILGVVLAVAVKQLLVFGLSTDMPVVAVLSQSMQHNDAERTHYGWLADKMGYDIPKIDSWPITGGFLVGDMPIIQGRDEYEVGDIVVYSVPGQSVPIIHRIIKINADGTYQTKGDNNMNQFPYELKVGESQIHGEVIFVVPKLGHFKVFMTKTLNL